MPGALEEGAGLVLVETGGVAPDHHPQHLRHAVVRLPGPRHAGATWEVAGTACQQVTFDQAMALAIQAAQAFTHLASHATQHRFGTDAARQCQIRALTMAGITDLQALPGLQAKARPVEARFAVDTQRHVGAGDGHP
ncbi:hypothetical protein D3C80_1698110 [compost metagenome]